MPTTSQTPSLSIDSTSHQPQLPLALSPTTAVDIPAGPSGHAVDRETPSSPNAFDASLQVAPFWTADAEDATTTGLRTFVSTQVAAPSPTQPAADPLPGRLTLPGRLISVTTTFVATLLAQFLAPGPAAPAQPPLLWAVLAWVRREVDRAFFNKTPNAVSDDVTTSEDTNVDIGGLANDVDADDPHSALAIVGYAQATHGSVVLHDDGTFTYTPDTEYCGADSFTYTVSDEAAAPHAPRPTVRRRPHSDRQRQHHRHRGRRPTRGDPDAYLASAPSGLLNRTVSGNVLSNDVSPEGRASTPILATPPNQAQQRSARAQRERIVHLPGKSHRRIRQLHLPRQ